MKFRWKLLVLLLSISLIPMLFLKGSGSESFKELTAKLVAETRATLTRNAEAQLRLFVTDTAFMLGSKGNVLEVAMYYFTHAAAGRIEHFENRSGLKPPPSISDFREDELPVSLGTHENYYRIRPSGKRVNLEVSFDVPSIRFPANVSAARKKAARFRGCEIVAIISSAGRCCH